MEYLAFGVVGATSWDLNRGDMLHLVWMRELVHNLGPLDQEIRDRTIYKIQRCMRYHAI